ncbi:uncharacterized protein LOC121372534 [Gigantopelta aegis]|uniref:uncharacterized protein LOC121372534 n=1 Tax=Gigantopelta aegis TaxID=1735272 RepID=UPI001B88C3FC|nr:uncharacterized protein LOC121372534 [Gigantopelta aegis]
MPNSVKRGPMRDRDVQCIKTFSVRIEQEVDAKDLVPYLYSVNIIDYNDKDEILRLGTTRLERIRTLVDIIHHRGVDAFSHFTQALNLKGYVDLAAKMQQEHEYEPQSSFLPECPLPADRLRLVENAWELLSRRLTKIEGKLGPIEMDSPEDEIASIKLELQEVKTVTFARMQELTEENREKDAKIQILMEQLKGKDHKLQEAQVKIKLLEKRTLDLERKLILSRKDIEKQTKLNRDQQTEMRNMKDQNTQLLNRTTTMEATMATQGDAIQKLQQQFESWTGKNNNSGRKKSAKTAKAVEFPTLRYNCKYTNK